MTGNVRHLHAHEHGFKAHPKDLKDCRTRLQDEEGGCTPEKERRELKRLIFNLGESFSRLSIQYGKASHLKQTLHLVLVFIFTVAFAGYFLKVMGHVKYVHTGSVHADFLLVHS